MTSIITRSALVFHGHNPAPNVHHVVIGHLGRRVVTWDEMIDARRKRQRENLDRKRRVTRIMPWKVWVAYFDQFPFGGWQAFIENRTECVWIDRDGKGFKDDLMRLFPLALLPDFALWKETFAAQYRRRQHHGKPLGVAVVWSDGWREIHLRPKAGAA